VGHYIVTNIRSTHALEAAMTLSSLLPETLHIDLHLPLLPFNKEAARLSQSGKNSTSGGTTPMWSSASLTGEGVVIGVADTGIDYNSCFFYDKDTPVTFRKGRDGVPVFDSTSHRKIRQ